MGAGNTKYRYSRMSNSQWGGHGSRHGVNGKVLVEQEGTESHVYGSVGKGNGHGKGR